MELLIVVGIMGILMALLMPSIFSALESARTSGCLSNLRQIGVASVSYSSENDGLLVPSSIPPPVGQDQPIRWRALLLPYIPTKDMQTFICPSSLDAKYMSKNNTAWRVSNGLQPCSYDVNSYFNYSEGLYPPGLHDVNNGWSNRHAKLASIPNPAGNIFVYDTGYPDDTSLPYSKWTEKGRGLTAACFSSEMPNNWGGHKWVLYPRHKQGRYTNALFYDGHVASVDVAKEIVACPPGNPGCLYDFQRGFK